MTGAAHLRKGWCPGALRPMRSGDGLLVRVRPHAGAFTLPALHVIANVAARFGSGEIDLTNRGNLQLRGVSDDSYDAAIAALRAAGLIDESAQIEAVRNVIVDPLSGIDPARSDVRALAAAFECMLVDDARLWALPGKFGVSFSGTSEPRVGGRATDIMIASDGDRFAVFLDGATDVSCTVSRSDVLGAVQRLALAFLGFAANDPSVRRMRDAVAARGAVMIFATAELRVTSSPVQARIDPLPPVGLQVRGEQVFGVGIGLPFGRIVADQLDRLCEATAAAKRNDVFTSPQRILVFPVNDRARAGALMKVADDIGLINAGSDVRLAMDVCPGSPGCKNAMTDTRGDAQRLVEGLNGSLGGYTVHVSGCEKGCARRSAADFTLVAREGRYDLIRNGSPQLAGVGDSVALAEVEPADIGKTVSRFIMESAS
ncbi:precorrin-3B synthase [Hyphomicrobium facile]|uniref:Precorrin-3B synthase n=1 Tax=Hyphomicrobium facile TaxID=51670 RepID=A0A1I7MW03_9HYPH|nr:precorrin-3B synthase [Hyphomicrobium facile]SFV26554.1 precorrin-3B synthase [Hyphomicrobium facile]